MAIIQNEFMLHMRKNQFKAALLLLLLGITSCSWQRRGTPLARLTLSEKGFNVIQVMLLHNLHITNVYGDSALVRFIC